MGKDFREYLKQWIAKGKAGHADLCSYFLLRDLSIARKGRVGIIATNTIAQGDTREVGLDQAVVDLHWNVYRAEKSQPWPGVAAIEVSLLWMGHIGLNEHRILDGEAVKDISPSLDSASRIPGRSFRLKVNEGLSFIGSYVLGTGFVLEPVEAEALRREDSRNKDVVFPYLNGEDLNSRPDCSARRWVINFGNMTDMEACRYELPWAVVERKVRPERQRTNPDGSFVLRRPLPQRWWQYADKRPALQRAIANLDRVLVIARVSKTGLPQFVHTGQVMSEQVVVFATNQPAYLSLLSSEIHFNWWTTKGESTLETRLRYTPSDGFETFPRPTETKRMSQEGTELDLFRRELMTRREIGLTTLYNGVHSEASMDSDTIRIREIHVEIDKAVREAYALDEEHEPQIREFEARIASAPLPSWREIDLGHGFHETPQGARFTISPQTRVDVLDKLLALNHYRYDQEVKRGLHNKKSRSKARASDTETPLLDDSALFTPPGAMF